MIEYVCPKCGARVEVQHILTNPITVCYRCTECDYHRDDQQYGDAVKVIAPPEKNDFNT
jgi:uncharacterized Zn finger protein